MPQSVAAKDGRKMWRPALVGLSGDTTTRDKSSYESERNRISIVQMCLQKRAKRACFEILKGVVVYTCFWCTLLFYSVQNDILKLK